MDKVEVQVVQLEVLEGQLTGREDKILRFHVSSSADGYLSSPGLYSVSIDFVAVYIAIIIVYSIYILI